MLRDTIKNEAYFEEYVIGKNRSIAKFEDRKKGIAADDKEKLSMCNRILASDYMNLIYARYSAGAKKRDIVPIFEKYVQCLNVCRTSCYKEQANLLALALLLEADYAKIKPALNEEYNDAFMNKLISCLNGYAGPELKSKLLKRVSHKKADKKTDKLMFKESYGVFYDCICQKASEAVLAEYMQNKWYESNIDESWYNAHESKNDVYVGYWCWIAAAVVKVRGFKNDGIKYVPYDLI